MSAPEVKPAGSQYEALRVDVVTAATMPWDFRKNLRRGVKSVP